MKTISLLVLSVLIMSLQGCTSTPNKTSPAEKRAKSADYHAQLGIGYLRKNRLDLAKMNLEKALARNTRSVDANHYYALLQEKLGDMGKATHHYRRAIQYGKNDSALLNNYGSHLCKTGQYNQAVNAFMNAVKDPLYRTPEFAYTNAGVCIQKQGDTQRAEGYFREALNRNPQFPLALYHMANAHHQNGDNPKAQAFLYRYNERARQTPETLLLCYKIHTALGEAQKALQCSNQLQANYSGSEEARQLN